VSCLHFINYGLIFHLYRPQAGCRKLKIRCEGAVQPPCKRCAKAGVECLFFVAPKVESLTSQQSVFSLFFHLFCPDLQFTDHRRIYRLESIVAEIIDYMQRQPRPDANLSSMSASVDPPFISTRTSLLPTSRSGSHLPSAEYNSPSDVGGDMIFPMPTDRVWPGPTLPPHHQEDSDLRTFELLARWEGSNNLTVEQVYVRPHPLEHANLEIRVAARASD
jgi:hypothetical protein